MRGLQIALVVGLVAAACSGAGSQAEPASATPSASASARLVPSPAAPPPAPSPTAPRPGAAPISSGPVPDAGVLFVWGADDGIYRYDAATGALSRVWGASTLVRETAYGPYVLGRHGGLTLLQWDGATEAKCSSGGFADLSIRGTCAFIGVGGDTAMYVDRGAGAQTLLPSDWGATSFAWSPDGAELAIIRRERRADPVPPLEPLWRSTLWHMDRHGALIAVDEVQTGIGRTGTFFAFEQWGAVPDIVTVAKALSGGYVPVGAVIAKAHVVEAVFDKMDRAVVHSTTFGQNVLAMTAGLATLHTIDAEHIVERAAKRGSRLLSGLQALEDRHEVVHEVRGRGLMIGIEFRRPRSRRLRAQWRILETMRTGLFTQLVVVPLFRDHRILTQVAGDNQNILKILPPLVITDEHADSFVDALDAVLTKLERSLGLLFGVGRSLAIPAIRKGR